MKTFTLVLAMLLTSYVISAQEVAIDSVNTIGSNEEISIYPNPVKEILTISAGTRYIILNLVAKPIMDGYGRKVDVTTLEKGHYFIQIYKGDTLIATKKFIKE